MVQFRPGLLVGYAWIRQLEERLDLKSGVCRFESCSGHCDTENGSVGNWQTTLA